MFALIPLVLSLCAAEPLAPSTRQANEPAAEIPVDVWLDAPLALTARTSVAGVGSVVTPSAALRGGVLWRAPALSSTLRWGADVALGVDSSTGPVAARVNTTLLHASLEPRLLVAQRFENGPLFLMPTLAVGAPVRLGNAGMVVGSQRLVHAVGSAGVTTTAGVLVGLHSMALRLEIGVGVEGPRPVRGLTVASGSWVFLL